MVKHTQTIRRLLADELNVFDHFVGLALKGLMSPSILKSRTSPLKYFWNLNPLEF